MTLFCLQQVPRVDHLTKLPSMYLNESMCPNQAIYQRAILNFLLEMPRLKSMLEMVDEAMVMNEDVLGGPKESRSLSVTLSFSRKPPKGDTKTKLIKETCLDQKFYA